jgi:hypothetical protein
VALVEIDQRAVADRLEAILTGLERYAVEQGALARERRDRIGIRKAPLARRVLRDLTTLQEDVLTARSATARSTAMIYSCARIRRA